MKRIILLLCTAALLLASEAPSITAPERSAGTPTWTWVSGGGSGQYAFRISGSSISGTLTAASHATVTIDGESWNGPVNLGSYAYDASDLGGPTLSHGDSVTLELRELNGVSWSASSTATIRVDTKGPYLVYVDPPGSLAAGQEAELTLQARDGESTADIEDVAAISTALEINQGSIISIAADPDDDSRIIVVMTVGSGNHSLILCPGEDLCTDLAGNPCQTDDMPGIVVSEELATIAAGSGVIPFGYSASAARDADELLQNGASLQVWNGASWESGDSLSPGQGAAIISSEATLPTILDPPLSEGSFEITTHNGWNLIALPFDQAIPWDSSVISVRQFDTVLDMGSAAEQGWCDDHAWLWSAGNDGYILLGEQCRGPGTSDSVPPWSAVWWYVKSGSVVLVINADNLQNQ